MTVDRTLIESFREVHYPKVTRSEEGYVLTRELVTSELERLLTTYRGLTVVNQRARLLRDGIDFWLRRYHGYAIGGGTGSHYRQVGVSENDCDFEHVIPQKIVRDMLIQNKLTITQAMNVPTCLIHKDLHKELKQSGWDSKTPSVWHFFDRYTNVFKAEFETHNGQAITDPHNWTLDKHYEFVGV
jgi:hypothetical protein